MTTFFSAGSAAVSRYSSSLAEWKDICNSVGGWGDICNSVERGEIFVTVWEGVEVFVTVWGGGVTVCAAPPPLGKSSTNVFPSPSMQNLSANFHTSFWHCANNAGITRYPYCVLELCILTDDWPELIPNRQRSPCLWGRVVCCFPTRY